MGLDVYSMSQRPRKKEVAFYENAGDARRLGRGYPIEDNGTVIMEYHGKRFPVEKVDGRYCLSNPADAVVVRVVQAHMKAKQQSRMSKIASV